MTESTLVRLVRARATGDELVLAEPAWSAPVRARVETLLDAARAAGRLGPGTLVTFSSGSTGVPKGIVRSHASWEDSLPIITGLTGIGPDDVVGLPGSLGASLYSFGAWHAASVGARVVLRGEPTDDVTAVHCVPTTLRAILSARRHGEWGRLRVAVVAGEPLREVEREQAARFGIDLVEYYGAAELSLVAVRREDGLAPVPGVECAIRAGRLWVRSPYAMNGYLDGTQGQADAGWRTVGDLVTGTPERFEVLGRGDLAVSIGGHTVAVEEVERALRALPDVEDVVAVGLPHPRLGQELAAVVEGATDVERLREAVRTWPAPSRPRRLIVAAMPRLPGGKPDRAAVREMLAR